ncbi:hypothetical protein KA082_00235 [Candidatus Woesebacteria bacterium]|nr:hypothetical protein [Candidatus Woesebacteria bacterium]
MHEGFTPEFASKQQLRAEQATVTENASSDTSVLQYWKTWVQEKLKVLFKGSAEQPFDPSRRKFLTETMPAFAVAAALPTVEFSQKIEVSPSPTESPFFITDAERENLEKNGLAEFIEVYELSKRFESTYGCKLPIYGLIQKILESSAAGSVPEIEEEKKVLEILGLPWGEKLSEVEEFAENILPYLKYVDAEGNEVGGGNLSDNVQRILRTFPFLSITTPLEFRLTNGTEELIVACGKNALGCTTAETITPGDQSDTQQANIILLHELLHHQISVSENVATEKNIIGASEYLDKTVFLNLLKTFFTTTTELLERSIQSSAENTNFNGLENFLPLQHVESSDAFALVPNLLEVVFNEPLNADQLTDWDSNSSESLKFFYDLFKRCVKALSTNEKINGQEARKIPEITNFLKKVIGGVFHEHLTLPLTDKNHTSENTMNAVAYDGKMQVFRALLPMLSAGKYPEMTAKEVIRDSLGFTSEQREYMQFKLSEYGFEELGTYTVDSINNYRISCYLTPEESGKPKVRHLYLQYSFGTNSGRWSDSVMLKIPENISLTSQDAVELQVDSNNKLLIITLKKDITIIMNISQQTDPNNFGKITHDGTRIESDLSQNSSATGGVEVLPLSELHKVGYSNYVYASRASIAIDRSGPAERVVHSASVVAFEDYTLQVFLTDTLTGFRAEKLADSATLLGKTFVVLPTDAGWQLVFDATLPQLFGNPENGQEHYLRPLREYLEKYNLRLPRFTSLESIFDTKSVLPYRIENKISGGQIMPHLWVYFTDPADQQISFEVPLISSAMSD